METHKYSFGILCDLAYSCGRDLERLASRLDEVRPFAEIDDDDDDDYIEEATDLSVKLLAIHHTMTILRHTPNSYINQESLDAFEAYLHRGKSVLSNRWARDLLGDELLSEGFIPW